jgi:hypothetical protein
VCIQQYQSDSQGFLDIEESAVEWKGEEDFVRNGCRGKSPERSLSVPDPKSLFYDRRRLGDIGRSNNGFGTNHGDSK